MRRFAPAPDGSVDAADRRHVGFNYRSGAVAVADMVALASDKRQVFTALTSTVGSINANPVDTAALTAYVGNLAVTSQVSQYDWSGLSICTRHNNGSGWMLWYSFPVTLISDTHAIASAHISPIVGDTCYWRTPAGGLASANVAAVSTVSGSGGELNLIRFSSNPSALLKRYKIATDASVIDYTGGGIWCLYFDFRIRLRVMTTLESSRVLHVDSVWNNDLTQGSGRPGLVALTNNDLIIVGTNWYANALQRSSAVTSAISTALSSYSETLTTYELPEPNYSAGEGGSEFVGKSPFYSHVFGRQR